jgi:hypothetical protein
MVNTQPGFTQFPGGFANGVSIRGVPVVNTNPARVFWVSSLIGSDVYRGTQQRPFRTLAKAITATTSAKNDVIYVMPGHTETVSTAAGILMNTTNVKVIGLGDGDDRPQFTFSTITTASLRITAAGCSISNIIGIAGINALTGPIDIRAAGAYVDVEWRDASAAVAAVSPVVTTAAANYLHLNLIVKGFAAGGSNTAGVTLVGGTGARINLDYYGYTGAAATSAIVVTSTTTVTDLVIFGDVNNNGGALFYDGAGSSTWAVRVMDGYADAMVTGGDRNAPSASGGADWRYFTVTADFTSATWNTQAAHRIATVSGLVEVRIIPVTTATVTAVGAATFVLGDSVTSNSIIPSTAVASFASAGLIWYNNAGTGALATTIAADAAESLQVLTYSGATAHNIGYTVGTSALLTGGLTFYIQWRPITPSATVTAGTGGVL